MAFEKSCAPATDVLDMINELIMAYPHSEDLNFANIFESVTLINVCQAKKTLPHFFFAEFRVMCVFICMSMPNFLLTTE